MADGVGVFVSHSSHDQVFAVVLVHALRQVGYDVWYDEDDLGTGHLPSEISEQVKTRPVFIVVLSKAAFASEWVRDECEWAYRFYKRNRDTRVILPVVALPIEESDFDDLVYLENFRRIEGPGYQPYPQAEAIQRTLRVLEAVMAKQAASASSQTPQSDPTLSRLITEGKAHMQSGEYDAAIDVFELGTRLAPGNFTVWFNLGLAQNELGYWEDSREAFEVALNIMPNNGAAWSNMGKAMLGLRDIEHALSDFERALAVDESVPLRWAGKGFALKQLKRYWEALIAFERAVFLNPGYGEAWAAKANVLWLLNETDEAMEVHERALQFNENAPLPWGYKALTFRALDALGNEPES